VSAATSNRQVKRAFVFASIGQLFSVINAFDTGFGGQFFFPWTKKNDLGTSKYVHMRRLFFRQLLPFKFNTCFSAHNELVEALSLASLRHLSDSSRRGTYESAFYPSLLRMHNVNNIPATASPTLPLRQLQHSYAIPLKHPSVGCAKCRRQEDESGVHPITYFQFSEKKQKRTVGLANFVKQIVPVYAQCLEVVFNVATLTFSDDIISLILARVY
jgi:hypothetical protein